MKFCNISTRSVFFHSHFTHTPLQTDRQARDKYIYVWKYFSNKPIWTLTTKNPKKKNPPSPPPLSRPASRSHALLSIAPQTAPFGDGKIPLPSSIHDRGQQQKQTVAKRMHACMHAVASPPLSNPVEKSKSKKNKKINATDGGQKKNKKKNVSAFPAQGEKKETERKRRAKSNRIQSQPFAVSKLIFRGGGATFAAKSPQRHARLDDRPAASEKFGHSAETIEFSFGRRNLRVVFLGWRIGNWELGGEEVCSAMQCRGISFSRALSLSPFLFSSLCVSLGGIRVSSFIHFPASMGCPCGQLNLLGEFFWA